MHLMKHADEDNCHGLRGLQVTSFIISINYWYRNRQSCITNCSREYIYDVYIQLQARYIKLNKMIKSYPRHVKNYNMIIIIIKKPNYRANYIIISFTHYCCILSKNIFVN